MQDFKIAMNPLSKIPPELKKGSVIKWELILSYKGEHLGSNEAKTSNITIAEKDREPFPIFKVPLQTLMDNERELYPDIPIPRFVRYAISNILTRGICVEGIFREGGNFSKCAEFRNEIDSEIEIDHIFAKQNIHNVTNVFKQWLRELPEPIFKYENYGIICSLGDESIAKKKQVFIDILQALPKENYFIIRQIFRLMYIVVQNTAANKMQYGTVSICLAPNLITSNSNTDNDVAHALGVINNFCAEMAEFYPEIFEKPEDDLFEIDYLQDTSKVC